MQTVETIINGFGTYREMARVLGIKPTAAKQMLARKSIHVKHWPKLVQECRTRKIRGVNYDVLVALHSKPCREGSAA